MGAATLGGVTIHANPFVDWQRKRANQMAIGLRRLGFEPVMSRSSQRISDDPAVLFGTTFWQQIEAAPGDWLLVDRANYGDPEYVRLAWNARGRLGKHMVPDDFEPERFQSHGVKLLPWQSVGSRVILCGDYLSVPAGRATHWRPHPRDNTTHVDLPIATDFNDCESVITGASSIAVECLINGLHVRVMDPRGMAWGWQSMGRKRLFEWLAWTQWSWDEIAEGKPIGHLFEWLNSSTSKDCASSS